jgi:hypothetical protein
MQRRNQFCVRPSLARRAVRPSVGMIYMYIFIYIYPEFVCVCVCVCQVYIICIYVSAVGEGGEVSVKGTLHARTCSCNNEN